MDISATKMMDFPGLLRPPDPVEVIRESIISVFSPSGPYCSRTDTCHLCKGKQTTATNNNNNNSNKEELVDFVNTFGRKESRQLLRGTLQSLLPNYYYCNYNKWGGAYWGMRLCEECSGLLTKLTEQYFEFEKAKEAFNEQRRRLSKAILVDKLKIPEKTYEKWIWELINTTTQSAEKETLWKTSKNDHVTITGGEHSISSEPNNANAAVTRVQDEEIKTEEEGHELDEDRGRNFFEEIEIEPDLYLDDKEVLIICIWCIKSTNLITINCQ